MALLSRLPGPAKRFVQRAYVAYRDRFPVDRGKTRLGRVMDALIGLAPYPIAGGELELTPTALLDNQLILHGIHDAPVVRALRASLRAGDVFLDVGANIGFMTLVGAELVGKEGRVHAFEPSPRELARLRRNVEQSGKSQVIVHPFGLGPEAKESRFFLAGGENPGMNTRIALHPSFTETVVRIAPLRDLVASAELERVRAVKIDVEGDELAVLEGMRDRLPQLRRATFVVEVTPPYLERAGGSAAALYDFFAAAGFCPTVRAGAPDDDAQYDEVFVPTTP